MSETVFSVLKRKCAEQKTDMTNYVMSGAPKDYADYKRAIGHYEGVCLIEEDIQDLEKKIIAD